MRGRHRVVALTLGLALVATGCTSTESTPATPTPGAPTATESSADGSAATDLPAGGSRQEPVALDAGSTILDWAPAPGSVRDTVTAGEAWTLTVDESSREYSLDGPGTGLGSGAPARERISDALLDDQYAAVVFQDTREQRPSRVEVTELASGDQFVLDGSSDVPTTNGGTWALGQGLLLHATVSDGAYCLARVDLADQSSTLGWCAPERHGFNSARISPAGSSLMTFDDARPACRSLVTVSTSSVVPWPQVQPCTGWEGVLLGGGAVWSVIEKEQQIENAHLFARVGDEYYDLGAGTSGTLTWCAGATYFVRDPQRSGDPARLLRWDPRRGLDVVYESPGGQAFLTAPRCGGGLLTLTALAEAGDEQVSARLN